MPGRHKLKEVNTRGHADAVEVDLQMLPALMIERRDH